MFVLIVPYRREQFEFRVRIIKAHRVIALIYIMMVSHSCEKNKNQSDQTIGVMENKKKFRKLNAQSFQRFFLNLS